MANTRNKGDDARQAKGGVTAEPAVSLPPSSVEVVLPGKTLLYSLAAAFVVGIIGGGAGGLVAGAFRGGKGYDSASTSRAFAESNEASRSTPQDESPPSQAGPPQSTNQGNLVAAIGSLNARIQELSALLGKLDALPPSADILNKIKECQRGLTQTLNAIGDEINGLQADDPLKQSLPKLQSQLSTLNEELKDLQALRQNR